MPAARFAALPDGGYAHTDVPGHASGYGGQRHNHPVYYNPSTRQVLRSFGAASAIPYGNASLTDLISQYAPAVNLLVEQFTDPARQVAVLTAELRNAKARGAPPAVIRFIEAKLEAAKVKLAQQQQTEQKKQELYSTGQLASASAVAVGAAATVLLLVLAFKAGSR